MSAFSLRSLRLEHYFWLTLILITLIGATLRFWQLGDIPIALNRDEASIGYNAYSLLKTGREEHGRAWPINVESFGDWKLPVYIYTTSLSIALFGLTEWAIRTPAALAGTLAIPLTALIARELMPKKTPTRVINATALMSGVVMATAPWAIRLSRQTYESMLGLCLVLTGAYLFLLAWKYPRHQWWLFPAAATPLALSLLTYHAYQAFVPAFVVGLTIIYRRDLILAWQKRVSSRWGVIVGTLIGLSAVALLIWGGGQSANTTKLSGNAALDRSSYHLTLFGQRQLFAQPESLPARLYTNTPLLISSTVWYNFTEIFSARFLFFDGGGHGAHDVAGMGNISPLVALLAVVGVVALARSHHTSFAAQFIAVWWLASLVAPLLTTNAAHSVRLLPMIAALSWSAGWGSVMLWQWSSSALARWQHFTIWTLGAALMAFHVFWTSTTYFVIAPQRDVDRWNWIVEAALPDITQLSQEHSVWIPYQEHSYASYLMFYQAIEPTSLSEKIEYAPINKDGYRHVNRLGNVRFDAMDWGTFTQAPHKQYVLVLEKDVPGDKWSLPLIREFTRPHSSQRFVILSNGQP